MTKAADNGSRDSISLYRMVSVISLTTTMGLGPAEELAKEVGRWDFFLAFTKQPAACSQNPL